MIAQRLLYVCEKDLQEPPLGQLKQGIFSGDEAAKELPIPVYMDQYSHGMNACDVADQFRQYYTTKRRHAQTWKPLWCFLLVTATTNAYLLSLFRDRYQHHRSPHLN